MCSNKKILCIVVTALLLAASAQLPAKAQSLWSSQNGISRSIYSDDKAHDVGDILTVIINESTTATATKSHTNSKEGRQTLHAGTGIFSFLAAASASGSDEFSANGSAGSTNRVAGRVSVIVTDVLPNGNLVIEGTQSIWQNRDEHKITVRGLVRSDDVSFSNTILSSQVANATLRIDGKGPLNAKQRQGIITQLFNVLF